MARCACAWTAGADSEVVPCSARHGGRCCARSSGHAQFGERTCLERAGYEYWSRPPLGSSPPPRSRVGVRDLIPLEGGSFFDEKPGSGFSAKLQFCDRLGGTACGKGEQKHHGGSHFTKCSQSL